VNAEDVRWRCVLPTRTTGLNYPSRSAKKRAGVCGPGPLRQRGKGVALPYSR
jgi:hypothetical protein